MLFEIKGVKICFVITIELQIEDFTGASRSWYNLTRITFHLRHCLLIFSDVFGKDIKLKYWLLAASVQNYLSWPLTAHIGAILVCNSTPGQHKLLLTHIPVMYTSTATCQTHHSDYPQYADPVLYYCFENLTLQLSLLCFRSTVFCRNWPVKRLKYPNTEGPLTYQVTDRQWSFWSLIVNDWIKHSLIQAPELKDFTAFQFQ